MIKSAGNRISPQEIEDAAVASGLVSEAVALGLPDPQLGQKIALAVHGPEERAVELEDHLKRTLPTFMHPREIRWFQRFPLNPNGKVDRVALRTEFVA